ncbi:HDOD domain-containing protein [Undibacterium sp. Jales W-56]|uniref:EAL and HDOD domain-containing protein n=1 Tax=Undibacterium sp. Jales W-56 TaxID=2897325 RepID=UPI0021D33C0A|nr:HDOD domain-containing protein [Undibacterium sp. Jales W-56]MCU6435364.1 HDOD domain-containing protein [Undibacterium sp. Jales W-56]
MTNANGFKLPLTALLPIVNHKQQLAALSMHFETDSVAQSLQLLQQLKQLEFFDKLPGLSLFISVDNPVALPADVAERIESSQVTLLVPDIAYADQEVQSKLQHLASKGIPLVVDDFTSKSAPVWEGARAVAVDCRNGVPVDVKPCLSSLPNGLHLAKKIATPVQLHEALDAGFNLFSGDYAFNPTPNGKSSDAGARARLLKLLGLVSRDAESRELEELFKQDGNLSFMLFKLVSSAAFAQTVKVTSFGQAINLLGRRQLQRWLQLLLYTRPQDSGGALNPLMLRAAFRASLMEAFCQKNGGNRDAQDCAFMVGMFSLLDTLFGSPLSEILQPLSLHDEVLAALLRHEGQLGRQLALVSCADRDHYGDGMINSDRLNAIGIDEVAYYEALIKAYVWVNQVCQDI